MCKLHTISFFINRRCKNICFKYYYNRAIWLFGSILYKFDWRKIIVSGILFGAITEIIQAGVEAFVGVNMHRIDINDVIANFSGVVIGYAGYCLLRILLEKIFQNGNVKIECEKYLSDFCFLERYY